MLNKYQLFLLNCCRLRLLLNNNLCVFYAFFVYILNSCLQALDIFFQCDVIFITFSDQPTCLLFKRCSLQKLIYFTFFLTHSLIRLLRSSMLSRYTLHRLEQNVGVYRTACVQHRPFRYQKTSSEIVLQTRTTWLTRFSLRVACFFLVNTFIMRFQILAIANESPYSVTVLWSRVQPDVGSVPRHSQGRI